MSGASGGATGVRPAAAPPGVRRARKQATLSANDAGAWLRLARKCGEEGRRWADAYLRFDSVAAMNAECLALLRAGRWEEGEDRLRAFRRRVDGVEGADPATRALLERWYEAVYGYYLYAREEFDAADAAMLRAEGSIATAIGHQPALLPMAVACHEFRLHRARIARNRRRFPAMWGYVEEVREMFDGRRPFCRLPDGREVGLAEVRRFLESLPGGADPDVARFLDDRARLEELDRFVRAMTRIPDFVIVYP